jgi:hypothetical protein
MNDDFEKLVKEAFGVFEWKLVHPETGLPPGFGPEPILEALNQLEDEVERLQEELAGWMNEDTHEVHALRGKVERLQEEREDSLSRWNQIAESEAEVERLGEWKARRQAGQESIDISLLRAEVERLREVLKSIASVEWVDESDGALLELKTIARNALADEEKE